MKLRILPFLFVSVLALLWLFAPSGVRADIVDENTVNLGSGAAGFYGESFVTPAPSNFDNIVFTFLTGGGGNFATGTGFLLSSEYLGAPTSLSNATPGFLGQATAAGNLYTFATGLTLAPATTYYFYVNTALAANAIVGGNVYAGRQFYYSDASGNNFAGQGVAADFRVTGTVVPEPSAIVLLLSAAFAGFLIRLKHSS